METAIAGNALQILFDFLFTADASEVRAYVERVQAAHPTLDRRQLAQVIVDEHSLGNGLLGAVTGMGSMMMLPLTIPIDVIKAWKIQDFMIKSIAHLYGYTPQNTDLKTALFLLLSNGSVEEIKQCVATEASQVVNRYAAGTIDSLKKAMIQMAAQEAPKVLAEALWRVCGRKMAEKVMEKSLAVAVPLVGAAIGGGMDWFSTQAIGQVSIEFFAQSGPEWINETFTRMWQQQA